MTSIHEVFAAFLLGVFQGYFLICGLIAVPVMWENTIQRSACKAQHNVPRCEKVIEWVPVTQAEENEQ